MKRDNIINTSTLLTYALMIVVNALANILPINNITTGNVSDSYPNLFAPAAITFSIWGVIYLLLGSYSIYQIFSKQRNSKLTRLINPLFIASSIINGVWIFAWHYQKIGLTVILMLALLLVLIRISDVINKDKLATKEKLLIKAPFGVYLGWITVATIANITTFFVSIGWNGFGLSETAWMILILLVGMGIAIWRMHKDQNIAYGLVPVWAYLGIWFKHTSSEGFNSSYKEVITAVLICITLLLLSNALLIIRKKSI